MQAEEQQQPDKAAEVYEILSQNISGGTVALQLEELKNEIEQKQQELDKSKPTVIASHNAAKAKEQWATELGIEAVKKLKACRGKCHQFYIPGDEKHMCLTTCSGFINCPSGARGKNSHPEVELLKKQWEDKNKELKLLKKKYRELKKRWDNEEKQKNQEKIFHT